MLTSYSLKLPREIYSGEHALQQMKAVTEGAKKIAVFCDKGIVNAGLLEYPLSIVRESGAEITVLDELSAEPTCDQVQAIVDIFRGIGADHIIAIGGGSVMDIAKLASILVTGKYTVRILSWTMRPGRQEV